MTLISRDQMPPRTPYEAELRERLVEAEKRAERYDRLVMAQDQVVKAGYAIRAAAGRPTFAHVAMFGNSLQELTQAIDALEHERARILLDMMPPEPFFPLIDGGRDQSEAHARVMEQARVALLRHETGSGYTILAIHGTDTWDFDFATSFSEAYEKLKHWNERAAREWPDMRFTLKTPMPGDVCECGGPLPAGHTQCLMCAARARFEEP